MYHAGIIHQDLGVTSGDVLVLNPYMQMFSGTSQLVDLAITRFSGNFFYLLVSFAEG